MVINMKSKKSNFSGSIGFVLAAAGSAVGVGNIWRFPFITGQNGGGMFVLLAWSICQPLVASGMEVTRLLVNNMREVTPDDARRIYQEVL